MGNKRPIMDRLMEKILKTDSCWLWTGSKIVGGYGSIFYEGRSQKAARVLYEITKGPIPDGLYLLHECDNPPCVNPDHLKPGTQAQNMADCDKRGRMFKPERAEACKRGHPTETSVKDYGNGKHHCMPCQRILQARYRDKKRKARLAALRPEAATKEGKPWAER